tara:strand:- start:11075 stop:11380 length:306 start_codon:yes stop_codon:yes gene_type:complete
MARFHVHLMTAEERDKDIIAANYDIMCFVENIYNREKIQALADLAIADHIESKDARVVCGVAIIAVGHQPMYSVTFKNNSIDKDKIKQVVKLFGLQERVFH